MIKYKYIVKLAQNELLAARWPLIIINPVLIFWCLFICDSASSVKNHLSTTLTYKHMFSDDILKLQMQVGGKKIVSVIFFN